MDRLNGAIGSLPIDRTMIDLSSWDCRIPAVLTSLWQFMTIQDLEAQLLLLSPSDKLEAIQILARSLSQTWRGIRKVPGVCGGEACIEGTRIPVWVLVSYRQLGVSDSEQLDNYPTLMASDLANAWIYATANSDEIAAAIQDNDQDEIED
jgi:uncharacterized protein (DUF433 family)